VRRRGTVSRKPAKTQHRKVTRPKRNAPTAARQGGPSAGDLQKQLDARTRELNEATARENATSEVLRIISSSPGELQPVFETILENATRICDAKFGNLYLCDGESFHIAEAHSTPSAFVEGRRRAPYFPSPNNAFGRMARTKSVIHVADLVAEQAYIEGDPGVVTAVKLGGVRTLVVVPMIKAGELIGALAIYRQEVRPFTGKQIELVTNFATQAVIAIENARLLNELRQRTDDLSEALEQQTATSEVLGVISSSPGELEPVFNVMLENAIRICEAKFGNLYLCEGDAFRTVALHGATPEYTEARWRAPLIRPAANTGLRRVLETKQVVQIADVQAVAGYLDNPVQAPFVQLSGARSLLSVPMLKDEELVGAIEIYRQEVCPFTDKQIALLRNFAAQAVIAIENTRLLNELRESLQQQTATSEVLQVISSSPSDLGPVFKAMLENATRLCEARFGNLLLYDGNTFRVAALHGAPRAWAEKRRREAVFHTSSNSGLARVVKTKRVQHIADLTAERAYIEGDPPTVAIADIAGARTLLLVPMLKEGELVGVIGIYRHEVRPFTDKQIALLTNFARQAVIAIENARLLSCASARMISANHCNSRPPPPTCSRSSAARRSTSAPYSIRWSSPRRGCAKRIKPRSPNHRMTSCCTPRASAFRRGSLRLQRGLDLCRAAGRSQVGSSLKANPFKLTMCWLIRNTISKVKKQRAFAPPLGSRCCARARPSA